MTICQNIILTLELRKEFSILHGLRNIEVGNKFTTLELGPRRSRLTSLFYKLGKYWLFF